MWKKTPFLIFLAVFLACSWFFSTGSWNQVSRIDAIMSFVEPPVGKRENPDFLTFRINHFVPSPEKGMNTGDWSYHKGNYYSNKAPGPMFLGIVTYAVLYWTEYFIFGFLDDILTDVINIYIINLVQSALPAALSACILFYILQMLSCGKNASIFWSLAYGLGTPVFCYSTMLWGHVLAASLFMFAIYFYLKKGKWNTVFCGLCCGGAVLSDYLCGALVPFFALMIFCREYGEMEKGRKEKLFAGIKKLFCFAAGGLPMFLLYAMYHKICFDSFFTPATVFNNPIFHDKGAVGGTFGMFKPFIILKLLISQHKGLFFYSPFLLFSLAGFWKMIRQKGEKKLLALGLGGIILFTLCAVSSFNGWHGGTACFARYLIVIIPAFIVLCGAFALDKWLWKLFAVISFCLSYCYMLMVAYLTPMVNEAVLDPIWGLGIESLRLTKNKLPAPHLVRMYSMIENMKETAASYSSFSIGELLGLSGYGSMALLTFLLAGIIAFLYREEWKKTKLLPEKIKKLKTFEFTLSFNWLLFLFLLLLLFAVPGMTIWINDEPHLIANALRNCDNNTFASKGLVGSLGFSYGAVAVWFYQMLLLLTFNPYLLLFLKTAVTVFLSIWAIKKLCQNIAFPDWKIVFVFLFASPYAWHYARILWDNVFLFPLAITFLAFLATAFNRENLSWKVAAGIGICSSLMLLLHPMSLPVVILYPGFLLLDLFIRKKDEKKKGSACIKIFVSALVASLPAMFFYLPQILNRIQNGGSISSGNTKILDMTLFYNFIQNLSGEGFGRWFIPELAKGHTILLWISPVLTILFGILLVGGICFILQKWRKKEYSSEWIFALYCFSVLACKIVMDLVLKLEQYPHYRTPVVPVTAFLVLTGAKFLWKDGKSQKIMKAGSCIMLACTVYIFLLIYCHDGTKSFVYGPTLKNQFEMVKKVEQFSRLGILNRFQHSVGNYRAFPHALKTLLELYRHSHKPMEKTLPPKGVKYNVILRYVSADPASGLLGLDIRQTAGPPYDVSTVLENK